jgi:hypothetical protein
MSSAADEWTLDGFVDHFDFVHHKTRPQIRVDPRRRGVVRLGNPVGK